MSAVNVTIAGARHTIRALIAAHRGTLKQIEEGQRFFKDGEDITGKLQKHITEEIRKCCAVDDALDYMKAGDVRKAAALCDQIKEFIPCV